MSRPTSPVPSRPLELIAGRYRLVAKLGEGGMGSVWEALDERLERPVAIKLIAQRLAEDPTARTRFEREAKASAQLRSPHIVELYDYGIDVRPFMVMELMKGCDLKERLASHRRLSLVDAAHIVTQLTRALTTAHAAGIVHRDLKPGNIFLLDNGTEEIVKIFDFGISKSLFLSGSVTADGTIMGTPRYMSPEQLQGEIDARADLWALAVIAYRMVTGTSPFRGGTEAVALAILSAKAPPPSTIVPSLEAEVDAFFERALAKNPRQRFADARALADAFCSAAGVSFSFSALNVSAGAREQAQAIPAPQLQSLTAPADSLTDEKAPLAHRASPKWLLACGGAALLVLGGIAAVAMREGESARLEPPAPVSATAVEPVTPPSSRASAEPRMAASSAGAPSAAPGLRHPAPPLRPKPPAPSAPREEDLFGHVE